MPITRRELLTTTAAAGVAAAVLTPEAPAMQVDEKRLQGNIKHSVVFWCFNIAGEKWDIDKTCSVAKSLGCKSVEICGPAEWPTLKKHGLTCAIAANGMPGATFISNEPALTFAVDDECRMQCRVNVETRTNAYQIRTGEFQDEQVSVYVTARQYGSLPADTTYIEIVDRLAKLCREVVDGYVVDGVLQPLARAIAMG